MISGNVNEMNNLINREKIAINDAKNDFKINGLDVNEKKTQCIFIGSSQLISAIPHDVKIFF